MELNLKYNQHIENADIRSDREAYFHVKNFLLIQGERSISDEGCSYRASHYEPDTVLDVDFDDEDYSASLVFTGEACAAGCLIKNDIYINAWGLIEGEAVTNGDVIESIRRSHPNWNLTRPDYDYEDTTSSETLLNMLQSIHDVVLPVMWSDAFEYAEKHIRWNDDGSIDELPPLISGGNIGESVLSYRKVKYPTQEIDNNGF